jgi:hypothetical protein
MIGPSHRTLPDNIEYLLVREGQQMVPAGFKLAIQASEEPQTHALVLFIAACKQNGRKEEDY